MDEDKTAVTSTVTDMRALPLGQIAGQHANAAAESLRHVLPEDETRRVAVAAFNSSI